MFLIMLYIFHYYSVRSIARAMLDVFTSRCRVISAAVSPRYSLLPLAINNKAQSETTSHIPIPYSQSNSGGKYLSVCFSERDHHFGSTGKYRGKPIGTILHFSSEEELKGLFSAYFKIIELKTIEIEGKYAPHLASYAFMEKR